MNQSACLTVPRPPTPVFRAPDGVRRRGARPASRAANMRRGVATTLVIGGALAVAMTCAAAGPDGRADPLPDPLPEAADVVSAFLTVRQWVDQFTLPDTADPAARLPLREASGVCVILRRSGQVKGIGFDTTGDDLMVRRGCW